MEDQFSLSFELFPPNTVRGLQNLRKTWNNLNDRFSPDYFSVTFGAGGGSQDKTLSVVRALCEDGINVAPHLTGINLTSSDIIYLLKIYRSLGIKRLVVLRGDWLQDDKPENNDFRYANELVSYIREVMGDCFFIEVAAYPEFHPESKSIADAFEHFKKKISAGANRAITQYFFNPDSYFYFVDTCRRFGINVPIVPGIMPISDFHKLLRFSNLCMAEIPRWLYKYLESYQDDQASLIACGIDVVTKLCEDLINYGVPGLHFYTLNQLSPVEKIAENLGLNTKPQLVRATKKSTIGNW